MSIQRNVVQGAYSPLLSAVRTTTQVINGLDLLDPLTNGNRTGIVQGLSGILIYLNVTVAPGVETLQLVVEEQDSLSGVFLPIASTLVTTATGMVKLKVYPGITTVAASATAITVNDVMPNIWRLRVVHSAASNWTYSLRIIGYN